MSERRTFRHPVFDRFERPPLTEEQLRGAHQVAINSLSKAQLDAVGLELWLCMNNVEGTTLKELENHAFEEMVRTGKRFPEDNLFLQHLGRRHQP